MRLKILGLSTLILALGMAPESNRAALISYWPFEEELDEQGKITFDAENENHGTIGNSVTRVPGLIGVGALGFQNDGGSFVNAGNGGEDNRFSVIDGISLEALISPTWSGNQGDYDEIFRKEDGGTRILFSFQNDTNNGFANPPVDSGPVLSFGLNVGGAYEELDMPLGVDLSSLAGGLAASGTVYLTDPGFDLGPNDVVLGDGGTHHVVAAYDDASGEKTIFVDGAPRWQVVSGFTQVMSGGGAIATIGNVGPSGGEPFTGTIDEMAFYDHGLTADEVLEHYNFVQDGLNYFGTQPPTPPDQDPPLANLPDPGDIAGLPSGVITYWDFNEGAGPTEGFSLNFAYDRKGSVNGTFEGTASRTAGIIGDGAAIFDNAGGSTINVGSGGPENIFSVTDGIAVEALIIPEWTGEQSDYDEIFRKEDGGNRILFSFQNDSFGGGAVIPVEPGPVLSLGLNIGGGYGELDMPLNVGLSELEGGNDDSGTIYLDDPGTELGPNDVVLKDGEAHHVLAQYDAETGDMAIFVDGVRRWSAVREAGAAVASGGGASGHIGSDRGGEVFEGVIDELAIWSRSLTQDEINEHIANVLMGLSYFGGIDILPGDANGDGAVNLADFNILKGNFGQTEGATVADGDFTGDGAVDLADFNLLKANFGQGGAAVPEPSTWLLAFFSVAALLPRIVRRRV